MTGGGYNEGRRNRVAVLGAGGQLGRQVASAFSASAWEVIALESSQFDIAASTADERLATLSPTVVVNCAAWTDVDGCARDPERALRINGEAPGALAITAARSGALFVQISTNEVFDGSASTPYAESDEPRPINPYGVSKLLAERLVLASSPMHLVIRTAWLFGPGGSNFVTKIIAAAQRAASERRSLHVVNDEWGNPTWTPALAQAILAAVQARRSGILHIAGVPPTTRFDWAAACCLAASLTVPIEGIASAEYVRLSQPPLRAVLDVTLSERLGMSAGPWRPPSDSYAAG
jgi:dTDP-4-dehydrorhamnose reductase